MPTRIYTMWGFTCCYILIYDFYFQLLGTITNIDTDFDATDRGSLLKILDEQQVHFLYLGLMRLAIVSWAIVATCGAWLRSDDLAFGMS